MLLTYFAILRDSWIFAARQACAVIVVLRAGLEVEVNKLRQLGFSTIRLIFLPGLCETFVVAMLARSIFGMPIALSFTMGFIIAAVGPAIILSGMGDLSSKEKLSLDGACIADLCKY